MGLGSWWCLGNSIEFESCPHRKLCHKGVFRAVTGRSRFWLGVRSMLVECFLLSLFVFIVLSLRKHVETVESLNSQKQ